MTYEENALAHYGIKGQKWGLRRFQNEDRTLTEAGKLRYRVGSGNEAKDAKAYGKEVKKYNKLRDKADIDLQRQKSEKHQKNAEKAIKVAGGLAKAGVGVAAGFGAAANITADRARNKAEFSSVYDYSANYLDSGVSNHGSRTLANFYGWEADDLRAKSKQFEKYATYAGAGLFGAAFIATGVAGQQKARSMIEKRRTTPAGHAKATKKLEAQYNKMINMFGNTPYQAMVEALPKEKS